MAKAHQAPSSTHRRRLWVTDHARNRLRSRIANKEGESHNGTEHRSDDDLSNWIDSLVRSAITSDKWEEIIDNGIPAQLVDIRHPDNRDDLWAIVKDNTNPRTRSEYPRAVVTLLYTRMVSDSKRSGKWGLASYDDGNVSIGGLTDEAQEALQSITPITRNGAEEMPEEAPAASGTILIRFLNKKGEKQEEMWSGVEDAEKSLNNLRRDPRVDTNSIRVFREVVTEARIVL